MICSIRKKGLVQFMGLEFWVHAVSALLCCIPGSTGQSSQQQNIIQQEGLIMSLKCACPMTYLPKCSTNCQYYRSLWSKPQHMDLWRTFNIQAIANTAVNCELITVNSVNGFQVKNSKRNSGQIDRSEMFRFNYNPSFLLFIVFPLV